MARFRVEVQPLETWREASGTWRFDLLFSAKGKGTNFNLSDQLPSPGLTTDWRGADTQCIEVISQIPPNTLALEYHGPSYEVSAKVEFLPSNDRIKRFSGTEALDTYEIVSVEDGGDTVRPGTETPHESSAGVRQAHEELPDLGEPATAAPRRGPPRETIFDFSADTPGLSDDIKASDDKLGIEDDVRTLCRLAMARSTKPPLAIGLFGDWGTGKSFFMRRMQTRIGEMQDEAVTSLGRGGTSSYCDNVVQIPFNAWHYADSNLWASLMTRIFEGLTPVTSDATRDYLFRQLESTRARLDQARRDDVKARKQLDAIKTERNSLQRALSAFNRQSRQPVSSLLGLLTLPDLPGQETAPQPPAGITTVRELQQAAQDARSTARLLRQLLDWWPFRLLLVTALLVVLGGLGVMAAGGGDMIVRALSTAAVVVPTVAATAGIAWRRFRQVVTTTSQADEVERWIESRLAVIEQRQQRLTRDQQQAQDLAEGAQRTLESMRAGHLIRQYVEDRVTNDAYRDQLGVISLVREDLRRLSDLLSPTDDRPDVLSMKARFDIQRIILYIDDLDRCPPDRVIAVLQAVHLLLAFPLFVVIVGVDSRWLIASLEIHYQRQLHGDEAGGQELDPEADEWDATPADYLDKIFQIPLSLRPMSDDGYRALVKNLMPVRTPATGSTPSAHSPPQPAERPGEGKTDSAAPLRSMPQPREVRCFAVEGEPCAARFAVGGRRLVIVTDVGIWVWNQGATGASREVSAPLRNARFSVDGEQLVYDTNDEWHTLELATGAAATYQRPPGAVAVAAGQQPGEIVYATKTQLVWRLGREINSQTWDQRPTVESLLVAEDRLLVRERSTLYVLVLPDLSNPEPLTADTKLGPVADMTLDYRDRTLYTLHPGRVAIWIWNGNDWGTRPDNEVDLTGIPADDPETRLFAGHAGVFLRHQRGSLHISRLRPTVTSVADTAPDEGVFGLYADPSTAGIVQWSSSTVIVARQDDAEPIEITRFPTNPIATAALSPSGGLVVTIGGGSCRLWYLGGTFEDEDVSQLELNPEEAKFIETLGPVVPTARAAKRLVNVYRLLRASKIGREKLQNPEGDEYKIALLLLSLVTGWPHLALVLFRELDNPTTEIESWIDLLDTIQKKPPHKEFMHARGPGRGDEDLDVLRALRKLSETAPPELDRYRAWAPHIRRFSMLTASQRAESDNLTPDPDSVKVATGANVSGTNRSTNAKD